MRIVSDNLIEIDGINTSIALGTFDGLHVGHRRIIKLAREYSAGIPVMVYAFENIPAAFFGGCEKAILSHDEKLAVMNTLDIDFLTMVKFDEHIVNMHPTDFLDYLYHELDAEVITCGYNYTFGKNAEGNPELIRDFCNKNNIVSAISEPIMYENEPVSSTRIRKALLSGDMESANAMLSYEYLIKGRVSEGKHLGHKIGFPTANLKFPEEKLVPKNGVYATRTIIDGIEYPSMTNIGVRPTVENTSVANAETYIIDYSGDIYENDITVHFIKFMRDERKFSDMDALKNQLIYDREIALQTYFSVIK